MQNIFSIGGCSGSFMYATPFLARNTNRPFIYDSNPHDIHSSFFANEWKAEHLIKTNHETIARYALDSNCARLRDIKNFALGPGNAHIRFVSAKPLSMKHTQYPMIYVYGMFS